MTTLFRYLIGHMEKAAWRTEGREGPYHSQIIVETFSCGLPQLQAPQHLICTFLLSLPPVSEEESFLFLSEADPMLSHLL